MSAYLELQKWWTRTATKITTEATPESEIAELEGRYGIVLPTDFREYLRFSSPVGEAWDSENVIWWDFRRIKNIPDECPDDLAPVIAQQASKYLFFADFAAWCWAYAISCADGDSYGKVALIAGIPHDKFVADSFSDFVWKCENEWDSLC